MRKLKEMLYLLLLFTPNGTLTAGDLILQSGHIRIVVSAEEPAPLKIAVEALRNDIQKVLMSRPEVLGEIPEKDGHPILVVVNRESHATEIPAADRQPLDGFESHRVWADSASGRIYMEGMDMRGAIFAVYTFSEKILGVPPLWYWCAWEPDVREKITVPGNFDLFFKSPQVRFRAWLPNDTDLFGPWRKLSENNHTLWLETILRLKLNTVECYNTVDFPFRLINDAMLIASYGLILTSHHVVSLNASIDLWDKYWKVMHHADTPPALSLAGEDKLVQFWRYCAETVTNSGIENLWNISFRGNGDKPFWATFPDSPEDEKSRGEIINRMLNIQMNIIREYSKEPDPYVRITFYDEMADLLAKGYISPPDGENMIWTYVAGRRDHYPYDDIREFDPSRKIKSGYYMNFQFSSTGAHLAPAEGPWKMEFNYRYVNSKSPLYFSVVNAGNLREFLFNLSANAGMLWDFNAYSSDAFAREYAALYFGQEHAGEIAQLYKDFFYAYWEPRKADFPGGMERQYVFQDQRYARAVRDITGHFFNYTPNPLPDGYGFERVPGRVYRIVPADNNADSQVDAMLNGLNASIEKFAEVTLRSEKLKMLIPAEKRLFFTDNIAAYSNYMEHLGRSLHHYVHAYKAQDSKAIRLRHIHAAIREAETAREALFATQHGVFKTWYASEHFFNFDDIIKSYQKVKNTIEKSEQQ